MGVPSLFRWLASRYPKMLANVIEELPTTVGEEEVPVDTTKPNPNQVEIDNLYLDMNGIIHPCCHPEDKAAPSSEEEMYIEIFKYIDRIFSMIRPRKVLFMAIDGVAPRAKMNQQRSRRFRAAREEAIKRAADERKKQELNLQGIETVEKEHFDSNCITPGTPFMEQLAISLRYYIVDRLNNNPGWKGVKVILSDSSVPGEGEHKIMDFIRNQKIHSNYDPNTKHVLYGLDADLIMLALATHEPHFWILREDVTYKASMKACEICGQIGHNAYNCRGIAKQKQGEYDEKTKLFDNKPFVFVHISILREYLEAEMKLFDIPFDWDLDRAIDDWVFMCFFIGNDFLPHLPSLEIREGAIDTLVGIWKQNTRRWKGYLTDSGDINLARVQDVLEDLGQVEDKVFQSRREQEERHRIQRLERKQKNRGDRPDLYKVQKREIDTLMERAIQDEEIGENGTTKVKILKRKTDASSTGNADFAKRLKIQLQSKLAKSKPADVRYSMDDFTDSSSKNPDELIIEEEMEDAGFVIPTNGPATATKSNLVLNLSETATPDESEALDSETIDTEIDSDEEAPPDNVRLWEGGWKQRYYENKFKVSEGDGEFRQKVVQSYVEGLCWVLKYYYQGVQSWKWFYPFHYAPFSSDFRNIQNLTIKFELSEPFKPIEQLLGVFPAASKQHIPKCFHFLMDSDQSPVIDFYPEDFEIDMNGKKHEWQGVALLPFIDAERLLAAVQPIYKKLTKDEAQRNSTGDSCLYLATGSKSFGQLCSIYSAKAEEVICSDFSK